MIVILTICSTNYLAQAKTLGDSLREHNPDYHFVIGLVVRWPASLDSTYCAGFEVIPVEQLVIPEFEDMRSRYNIVELNTAVKPFYMEYLYRRDSKVTSVIYFDPDILILASLSPLEENLRTHNIILTPHCCTYNEDDPTYGYELGMLGTGIYNLGFLATSRSSETFRFLTWWQKRLIKYCYYYPGGGIFVDQLWTILAPLYFQFVYVEKNPGYNVCYWNLRERSLTKLNEGYRVNGDHDLLFYHFSSYTPTTPAYLANRLPLVLLCDHPELAGLLDTYRIRLLANRYDRLSKLECFYYPKPPSPSTKQELKNRLKLSAAALLRIPPLKMQRYFRRVASFIAANSANTSAKTSKRS